MKKILLSFKPFWAEKIKTGEKIFEYRKRFCDEPVIAYMYVSRPVMAVTGIVKLDKRIDLDYWFKEYINDPEVAGRIAEFRTRNRYAMPIKEFIPTSSLGLREIQNKIPGFMAPQMYYCLEEGSELCALLEQEIVKKSPKIINNFGGCLRNEICKI